MGGVWQSLPSRTFLLDDTDTLPRPEKIVVPVGESLYLAAFRLTVPRWVSGDGKKTAVFEAHLSSLRPQPPGGGKPHIAHCGGTGQW